LSFPQSLVVSQEDKVGCPGRTYHAHPRLDKSARRAVPPLPSRLVDRDCALVEPRAFVEGSRRADRAADRIARGRHSHHANAPPTRSTRLAPTASSSGITLVKSSPSSRFSHPETRTAVPPCAILSRRPSIFSVAASTC
jgi:hypothetical protein